MEKAKAAVQDFISRDGKHKTTVDEDIRAPVTEEHIRPHQHDEVATAVDRSVHVDHHHTTVQPVSAKETLPEQHSHNVMPVEHKTVHHGNERELKDTLERDAAKYHDTSTTHHTTHSASTAPVAVGERTHHHVHEHVQPVIQKEVVAPQVVHTTVPVHETHHVGAEHHGTSVLPAKTLEEFKATGASLEGRGATRVGEFEGQPKPYDSSLQTEQLEGDRHMSTSSGHHHQPHHGREGLAVGAAGAGGIAAAEGLSSHHQHREGEGLTGTSTSRGAEGLAGTTAGREVGGLTGTSATGRGTEGFTNTSTTRGAEGLTGTTGTEHSHHTGHSHTREGAVAGGTAAAAEGLTGSRHHREGEGLTDTRHHREADGLTGTSTTRETEGLSGTTGTGSGLSHTREGMANTSTATHPTSSTAHHTSTTGAGDDLGAQADRAFFSGPHEGSKLTTGTAGDRFPESSHLGGSGLGGSGVGNAEKVNSEGAYGGPGVATGATTGTTTGATEERKPSLADKLNPFKDADGDGKKGFMK